MANSIMNFGLRPRSHCSNFAVCVLLIAAMLLSSNAQAFKIDTHIWIAQQVINDLADDANLSFKLGDTLVHIPVDEQIQQAILSNPTTYLLGNIGPDALPGIYEGQMVIHPGSETDGWGTGDWLGHLLHSAKNPEETALAYGFLGHAAADVFAHSYVNHYAGDSYQLTDNETAVERRHFLLEGYIAERMPPLLGTGGSPLGRPSELILRQGKIPVPTDFLHRIFLESSDAAREFRRNGAPHIAAVHDLNLWLIEVTKSAGLLDDLHILTQQAITYYYFGIVVKKADLKKFNDLHQKVRNLANDALDDAQEVHRNFRDEAQRAIKNAHKTVENALDEAERFLENLKRLHEAKQGIEKDIADLEDSLRGLVDPPCRSIPTNACNFSCRVSGPFGTSFDSPGCLAAKASCKRAGRHLKTVCDLHANRPGLQDAVRLKQDIENRLINEISNEMSRFKTAMSKAHAATESALKAETDLLHSAIDLLQRFGADVNPIRGIFTAWLDDNEKAMKEYFMANAQAIHHSMIGEDVLDPLQHWVSCWAPALIGIPSQFPEGICATRNAYHDITEALDALEDLALGPDPVLREIKRIKDKIKEGLEAALTQELYNYGSEITGVDIQNLIDILTEKPTKARLDLEFSRSPGEKALVLVPNASERIDTEMFLKDTFFDPNRYSVVYNAVALAKLSLLNAEGLNILAGRHVYDGKSLATSNALIRLARSIDGNHQWMEESPPYARSNGENVGGKRYGYPNGWPFWQNISLRNKVFRQLFLGPLNPGIDTPHVHGFSDVLPANYDYVVTMKCPYPGYPAADPCPPSLLDQVINLLIN